MSIHNSTHGLESMGLLPQMILTFPFLIVLIFYLLAAFVCNRKYKQRWPYYRIGLWGVGIICAVMAVTGPIAEQAHGDFTMHMLGHLLLGMLSPLLLALAAPMTLLLRVLPVKKARNLTSLLKSFPVRLISNPIIASVLNIGGLWVLYTTPLYTMMHESHWLYVLIHAHVFLAGYVFTISFIYIDPISHRTSYVYRSIVLIVALAAHGILSKYIYVHPPAGVHTIQAEKGAMLMYYGGDLIDAVIIITLCYSWYKKQRPQTPTTASSFVQH